MQRSTLGKMLIAAGIMGVGVTIFLLAQRNYGCDWTGFGECLSKKGADQDLRREKTLWDWLQLLVIPSIIAVAGFWFNRIEKNREARQTMQEAERDTARTAANAERERMRADERTKNEREIADDRLREEAMTTYLDKMSEMLDVKDVPGFLTPVAVIRARTLTILQRLAEDKTRRVSVLRFLSEAQLVAPTRGILIRNRNDLSRYDWSDTDLSKLHLQEANLGEIDLSRGDLREADLTKADLRRAVLIGARLEVAVLREARLELAHLDGAHLDEAQLDGAHLDEAGLTSADLRSANLTKADLRFANLDRADLRGAILTDSIYNRATQWPVGFDAKAVGSLLVDY